MFADADADADADIDHALERNHQDVFFNQVVHCYTLKLLQEKSLQKLMQRINATAFQRVTYA